ncbi:sodium-independent sulfate anion transporter-like [Brienomyrus brachyistius]|uniref:sodium-independent sulfate anion transporter-like n=1 Tax=Brienomyrus brachyistius TaxID=42636 RepID=UPI0020B192F9|nr:sodium-independent sulfate anion transporter-like [Brienomyrus brachyistius]XP_048847154.1 sodium-independent sulfate anion transporter-like [Brienomyrus brachyistius]XP_048847155.1 sodium-independent sulfate anion transporter-like [Brienomyrus brachyistius]XP_048847156.1 sodium-independent sulfate anion transporter-like [Brienomyrus brachyistius]
MDHASDFHLPLVTGGCPSGRVGLWPTYGTLKAWLPILGWLPRYRYSWLQMDLIAGFTVGLTTVPQSLAYAEVVGLPPQYGLYSALMGGFIYCIFGTSKDVVLGPTAIMSLLCAPHVGHHPGHAVLLTFLCGVIQVIMAILRLGFLLDHISDSVIKGFTCAAAVTIVFGQLKNLLGVEDIPQQFFEQMYYTCMKIPEARPGDILMGALCLGMLVFLPKWLKSSGQSSEDRFSGSRRLQGLIWGLVTARSVLVVIIATCVGWLFDAFDYKFLTLTGEASQGLPPLKPPPFSETTSNGTVIAFSDIVQSLEGGLVIIPLMGLLESIAIAKAYASQNNYRIDTNQEIFSIGLTNILGSFVSSYPVTGSFGRSAVNSQTGVCTPAGGIVTGTIVLLSLAFFMPFFHYIPKASLAAVIICSVAPMADHRVLPDLWRNRRLDLLPFLVTFLISFWAVPLGIVGGVSASGIINIYKRTKSVQRSIKTLGNTQNI